MESLDQKAVAMLQRCENVTLASIDLGGYPRPIVMSKLRSDEKLSVWVSTGSDSKKTEQFRKNSKGGLSFSENGNSATLTGEVEIISDAETKSSLWSDWMINHFPGGANDPNFCVLKFTPVAATFWIDNEFIHRKIR